MNHDNFVLLVVVSIHANLQGIDFDSTEDVIITRITELLNGRSPEDSSRILEGAQIRIIGARKGQSVVIYIFCKTLSDLLDLKEMHVSGELTTHLRAMFSQIISRSHCVDVNAENLLSNRSSRNYFIALMLPNWTLPSMNGNLKNAFHIFPVSILVRVRFRISKVYPTQPVISVITRDTIWYDRVV